VPKPENRFLYELPRTHHNGELTDQHLGQEVSLMGWVQTRRDHGGVIFVDLRDREGLTQIVFDPQIHVEAHQQADQLRSEFCIAVRGHVRARPEGMINTKLPTGKIEVAVERLEIFNKSPVPPFPIEDDDKTNETVRLEYRYLDLRRKKIQTPLMIRSRLTQIIRDFFHDRKFVEVETPFLTKSTPEGARDYLVPSRLNPGYAYALPQSPQLFKQILMVAGFERYFQIARCFRDEDLRADRQPDFTQLDLEMSFINEDQILGLMEELWVKVWKDILGVQLKAPFQRISYRDAVERYGSDKPDLRLDWELVSVTDVFSQSEFKVFRDTAQSGGKIQVLRVPNGSSLTRKDLDDLTPLGKTYGAKGIAWIKIEKLHDFQEGWKSPISKFLSDAEKKALIEKTSLQEGDVLVFCADKAKIVADSLGFLRLHLGKKLNALREEEWRFVWVVDFPMFQWDDDDKRWVSEHHPFTGPKPEFVETFDKDPGNAMANCYDMVLNGMEMGSGSIRIHNSEVQSRVFRLLKLTDQEIQEKFGFLIEALSYGAPPHGGVAFGLDRLTMVLSGGESLRDVIAFPKTQRGQCLMTKAPTEISKQQWKDLHLRVELPE
jgi:aspartyl-tRNA synthetase